jgi:hypothetical protein
LLGLAQLESGPPCAERAVMELQQAVMADSSINCVADRGGVPTPLVGVAATDGGDKAAGAPMCLYHVRYQDTAGVLQLLPNTVQWQASGGSAETPTATKQFHLADYIRHEVSQRTEKKVTLTLTTTCGVFNHNHVFDFTQADCQWSTEARDKFLDGMLEQLHKKQGEAMVPSSSSQDAPTVPEGLSLTSPGCPLHSLPGWALPTLQGCPCTGHPGRMHRASWEHVHFPRMPCAPSQDALCPPPSCPGMPPPPSLRSMAALNHRLKTR